MKRSGLIYDNNWFKKRAFESIHKISPNTWDYSDSLLLYISSGVEQYESLQDTDTQYFKLVTKPERDYLQSIASNVVDLLPNKFEYIDLGPGTEHKEQFFFNELKKQEKEFTYIPVDISEYYLNLAEKHSISQGISVKPIQASFEELSEILEEPTLPRLVNIGLTFSNYDPQIILRMLKKIAGKEGYVFINSQMRDRIDMEALQKTYAEDAITIADDKLKLIGLNPASDVTPRITNDEIKGWCTVINPTSELREKGMISGDTIFIFQSLRYTKESLIKEVEKISTHYNLFDTGSLFIATLIRT